MPAYNLAVNDVRYPQAECLDTMTGKSISSKCILINRLAPLSSAKRAHPSKPTADTSRLTWKQQHRFCMHINNRARP